MGNVRASESMAKGMKVPCLTAAQSIIFKYCKLQHTTQQMAKPTVLSVLGGERGTETTC